MMQREDVEQYPDRTVYCLHCDGEFKARDLIVKRFGVWCADRNCDGGVSRFEL